jgi:RecB family exonuclease
MKLSYSSMSTYNQCPKKWELKYVRKMAEKAKHFFSLGKSVHSALEAMHGGEACPSEDEVAAALHANWRSEGYKDAAAEAKAKRDAEAMVRAYHKKHSRLWLKPLAVELAFDITVRAVRFIGFIDRVDVGEDGGLHVLDYKTGRELDTARIAEDEQLTAYQVASETVFPESKVDKLSLYHVPSLTLHSAGRRGAELVARFEENVAATAAGIAAKDFPAKPSEDACKWCDFKAACPAWAPR